MSGVLSFWAVSLLVAALALPPSARLFRRLPDTGAGLSFALGLTLIGYGYFLFRILRVLPAGRGGYILALALFALVSLAVLVRDRRIAATARRSWPSWLMAAGVFSLFYFGYVGFRSYNPDIGGTEQPMDLLFLNATMVSPEYPPHDPWLAGERISYYYFGYLQSGILTATAGVPASTGYNLSLAYTFGAVAAGAVSLVTLLARWSLGSRGRRWALTAGFAAVGMLLFVGSLSALFEWAAAHGHYSRGLYRAFGLENLLPCVPLGPADCYRGAAERTTSWYPTEFWFWWRGSRVIPGTITEFPFFSFLLGDLHPHVMGLPLALLSLGISAVTWRKRGSATYRAHLSSPFEAAVLGILFGALAFENAWDLPTFSAVFALAVLLRNFRYDSTTRALLNTGGYLAPVFAVAAVAYLPWYLGFSSQASGFYPYIGEGTKPLQAFLQFGPLLAAGLLGLTFAFRRAGMRVTTDAMWVAAWIPVIPFILWVLLAMAHGDLRSGIHARTAGGWVTLVAYGLCVWGFASGALALATLRRGAAFTLLLLTLGALLLLGAELFLVRDVFFGGVPRLNTVFKLTYQAWLLLSVGGAVALATTLRDLVQTRRPFAALAAPAVLLLVSGLVYPLLATMNRTDGLSSPTGIDGLSSLARGNPAEYALTNWVAENTAPGDIIMEATGRVWTRDARGSVTLTNAGNDYSPAGRISSRTGRQTPLGWYFHEIQWRGDTKENRDRFTALQNQMDDAYLGSSEKVIQSMKDTGARYLIVGATGGTESSLERARYGDLPDYASFMDVVFESGDGRVYALRQSYEVPTS